MKSIDGGSINNYLFLSQFTAVDFAGFWERVEKRKIAPVIKYEKKSMSFPPACRRGRCKQESCLNSNNYCRCDRFL